jgi:hypothetical protein
MMQSVNASNSPVAKAAQILLAVAMKRVGIQELGYTVRLIWSFQASPGRSACPVRALTPHGRL